MNQTKAEGEAMSMEIKVYHWIRRKKETLKRYILVYRPDNHLADKHGLRLEHRLVAEQKYGRKLTIFGHCTSQLTAIRQNNNPENIVVLTRSEHAKLHNGLKKMQQTEEYKCLTRSFYKED